MLSLVLKILAITGMILLILLAVLLVVLLLILFFPITYRGFGQKNSSEINAWLKMNWLFGLFRVRFRYPQPGNVTVKLLWFTLFDSAAPKSDKKEKSSNKNDVSDSNDKNHNDKDHNNKNGNHKNPVEISKRIPDENNQTIQQPIVDGNELSDKYNSAEEPKDAETTFSETENKQQEKSGIQEWIFNKYEKIKYTIRKIYDKIKHILDNISFYKTFLQDEQTLGLFRHALHRLGKILKSIRPRKLKGHVLFGAGAPDTTGYLFGFYGMLSAWLGKYINVTPDFTQSILEGELSIAGHITVFQLLRHILMVVLDKRLKLLIHRIKTHKI